MAGYEVAKSDSLVLYHSLHEESGCSGDTRAHGHGGKVPAPLLHTVGRSMLPP